MAPHPAAPLRFLSLNADSNHNLGLGKGEQDLRGILLAQFLLQYDLVCLMECKWQEQNVLPYLQRGLALDSELKAALQPWRCVSQTTVMPSKTCILYNSDRLQLLEDIDVPAVFGRLLGELGSASSGLPADSLEDRRRSKELLNRCCAVVLQDKAAPDTSFVALSFHGHHRSVSDHKKCELFRLFARLASAIAASRDLPVVFGGDFNLHLRAFVADLQPAMTASKLAVYENGMTSSKRPRKKLVDAIGVVGPPGEQAGTATRAYCGNIGLLQLPSSRAEAEQLWHPETIQRLDEYDAKAAQQQQESTARGGKRPQRHIIFWPALEQLMGPAGLFDHDGICAQLSLGHNSALQEAPLLQPLPLAAGAAAAAAAVVVTATAAAGAAAGGAAAATAAKQRGARTAAAAKTAKQGPQAVAGAAGRAPAIELAVPTAAKPKAAPSTRKAARPKAPSPSAAVTDGVGRFIEELRAAAAGAAAAIAAETQRKRLAKPRAALAAAEE